MGIDSCRILGQLQTDQTLALTQQLRTQDLSSSRSHHYGQRLNPAPTTILAPFSTRFEISNYIGVMVTHHAVTGRNLQGLDCGLTVFTSPAIASMKHAVVQLV